MSQTKTQAGRGSPHLPLPKGLRHPPVAALLAVALLIFLSSSDFYARQFWLDHPATTATLAALAVVLVSVSVIEVILSRRSERRWRLLAQYALLELAEAARGAWGVLLGIVEAKSNGSDHDADPAAVTRVLDSPDRAPAFKRTLEAILTDPHKRDDLRESLEQTLDVSRELISRWGAVLTGSSSFSELFDRHVEMIGRIHGLWYFLAYGTRRGSRFRSPGGRHSDDWFVDNLLSMTRIAIRLEEETWAIALEVVTPDWWDKRTDELAAPAHAPPL
ncbi:MAG: hypothetical protein QOI82_1859 [Actinomycetota bacterium]|jgi:hypothetical protein|nr:hypothetical protein [Actinomycetota bacterium]